MKPGSDHNESDSIASEKNDKKKADNDSKIKKVILKIHVIRNCT